MLVVIARDAFGSTGSCTGVLQADMILHMLQGQSVGTVRRTPRQRRSWRHGQLDGMPTNTSVTRLLACLHVALIDAGITHVCTDPRC